MERSDEPRLAVLIDAMDLMHTGRFDGFVLVSSDSDFARLASRLREQGLQVFGIGKRNTPDAFRKACKRFICAGEGNLRPEDVHRAGAAPSFRALRSRAQLASPPSSHDRAPASAICAIRRVRSTWLSLWP